MKKLAGQLGHDLLRENGRRGHQAIGADLGDRWNGRQMDIKDAEAVSRTIYEINPDIIYRCAAWTTVEDAEETVFRVNARGVTEYCRRV